MEIRTEMLAVLFAETIGTDAIFESLGETQGWEQVRGALAMMRDETERHRGTCIKTIGGNELMCSFPSAESAVTAAIGIHERLVRDFPATIADKPSHLSARIGINFGEVIPKDDDVFGDSVNVAARMMQAAKGGQILTTGETLATLPAKQRAMARLIDRVTVKGKTALVEIHEIVWEEEGSTRMVTNVVDKATQSARLTLRYKDRVTELDEHSRGIVLGRGVQADIRVDDADASRMHLKVDIQRGKFVVMDDSVNGTYLVTPQGPLRLGKKETFTLRGKGVISLGRDPAGNPEVVAYECADEDA